MLLLLYRNMSLAKASMKIVSFLKKIIIHPMGRIISKLISSRLITENWFPKFWLAYSEISFDISQSKCSNQFRDNSAQGFCPKWLHSKMSLLSVYQLSICWLFLIWFDKSNWGNFCCCKNVSENISNTNLSIENFSLQSLD